MQLTCTSSGFRAAFFSWVLGLMLCCGPMPTRAQEAQEARGEHATPSAASIDAATWMERAERLGLNHNSTWHALLHLKQGRPQLVDDRFLLSLNDFSPLHELRATLALLLGPEADAAVCRFPARQLWLQQAMGLPERTTAHCKALEEFRQRAPADTISLVFASENLAQPSSMMGHLFLKVSGRLNDGSVREHAIAFFTDADTLNLPKLFYESMVKGKAGYFVLTPYQDEARSYVNLEQRSLWEYALTLTNEQRRMMQAHIHELRQARITYFFQDYNCATLVKHLLAVAQPGVLEGSEWWTTPKGVLQRAQRSGLIGDTQIQSPSRWRVRSLVDSMDAADVREVTALVDAQATQGLLPADAPEDTKAFLRLQLAMAYNSHRVEREQVARDPALAYASSLRALAARHHSNLSLHADTSKDPVLSPAERQVSVGWRHQSGEDHVRLGLLPVSHDLIDDNRQHFGETELRLFDTSVLVNARTGSLRLERFTLYSTQSLLPHESLTGGVSGRFKIGVEPRLSVRGDERLALNVEGALGRTWRVLDDVDAFAMLGASWSWRQQGQALVAPSIGAVIREVLDMKSIIRHSVHIQPVDGRPSIKEWSWTQARYLNPTNTVLLEWRSLSQEGTRLQQLSLGFKRLF